MSNKRGNGIGKFIGGALVGAGLGILFAPKKGSETRQDLKNKMDELVQKVREIKMDDVKQAIENKIDEIQEELEDLDREKVIKIAKKKARQIQEKAQELVDMAVEKGSPVLQKAADEVRQKTIAVVKEVLVKLEGTDEKTAKKA